MRNFIRRWGYGVILSLGLGACFAPYGFAEVYGDAATKRYHAAQCPETPIIKKKNLKMFDSEAEARAKTFYACPLCSAPARKDGNTAAAQQRKMSQAVSRGEGYIVDTQAKTYHNPWCSLVKNLDSKHIRKFTEIEKASAGGNLPCAVCNPPVPFVRAASTPGTSEKVSGGAGKSAAPVDDEKEKK
jgi:methylphosphotriester-DNA--protein-cysteine methyltransferase